MDTAAAAAASLAAVPPLPGAGTSPTGAAAAVGGDRIERTQHPAQGAPTSSARTGTGAGIEEGGAGTAAPRGVPSAASARARTCDGSRAFPSSSGPRARSLLVAGLMIKP